MPEGSKQDIVLAPNEYVYIKDLKSGDVRVYVGHNQVSPTNDDLPVSFDGKIFIPTTAEEATQLWPVAPEGWYMCLKNPATDKDKHPDYKKENKSTDLKVGCKVNIPGPHTRPLWPGQMAKIIKGHHLRTNQYLLVRIYDDVAATENWKDAVIKPADVEVPLITKTGVDDIEDGKGHVEDGKGRIEVKDAPISTVTPRKFSMGQLTVIKGTEVSFFVPPTGVEVVPISVSPKKGDDNYARKAVTLEKLEYCIKIDESGKKTFEYGEKTVFPEPTEVFHNVKVGDKMVRKFRAIDLNELSGLHIKVIAPYKDEEGTEYKEGKELFITGKEKQTYFPRPEHAIVTQGGPKRHFATAIPAGNGRYALHKKTGKMELIHGEKMWLPDPREMIPVRRVLSLKVAKLLYPGNTIVEQVNAALREVASSVGGSGIVTEKSLRSRGRRMTKKKGMASSREASFQLLSSDVIGEHGSEWGEDVHGEAAGEEIERSPDYTPQQAAVLDDKFEGAVSVTVFNGYAILLARKASEKGEKGKVSQRRVVEGPQTVLLEYDEDPESFMLSTGKPKNMDRAKEDVYLRVRHNYVTDIVEVETNDFNKVSLKISYRVNFEGDKPEDKLRWFAVDNYVKFLCDFMKSMLRNIAKRYSIEEFYNNAASICRDAILARPGPQDEMAEGSDRGRLFQENNMLVYEADVLEVTIKDVEIAKLLREAQVNAVINHLEIMKQQQQVVLAETTEQNKQRVAELQSGTEVAAAALLAKLEAAQHDQQLKKIQTEIAEEEAENAKASETIKREEEAHLFDLKQREAALKLKLAELEAESAAYLKRAAAVTPQLVAAIETAGARILTSNFAEHLGVRSYLEGESPLAVLMRGLEGMGVEGFLNKLKGSNGHSDDTPEPLLPPPAPSSSSDHNL